MPVVQGRAHRQQPSGESVRVARVTLVIAAAAIVGACSTSSPAPASPADQTEPGQFACEMVQSEMNAFEEGAGYETREEAVGAVGSTIADGVFVDTDVFLFFEVRDESGELVEQLRLERIDERWLVAETKTCFTG